MLAIICFRMRQVKTARFFNYFFVFIQYGDFLASILTAKNFCCVLRKKTMLQCKAIDVKVCDR